MDLLSQIQRMLLPIKRKISLLLQKALVQSVTDSKNIQLVKVKLGSDDIKDMVERLQPYGLTSVPSEGAEALVGFIGGNRDNGVVIMIDDSQSRKKDLLPGDVAVYRKGGPYMILKSDSIEVYHGTKIQINAPTVEIGDTAMEEVVKKSFLALFNSHTHTFPATGVAPTSIPISQVVIPSNITKTIIK